MGLETGLTELRRVYVSLANVELSNRFFDLTLMLAWPSSRRRIKLVTGRNELVMHIIVLIANQSKND